MDRTNGRTERYGKVRADLTYFDAAPEFVNEPDFEETADDPDPPRATESVAGETAADGMEVADGMSFEGDEIFAEGYIFAGGSDNSAGLSFAGEKVPGKKESGGEDKPSASEKSAEWLDPALAVCPFFVQAMRRGVVCEGLAERSELRTRFRSVPDRNAHYERYCCSFSGCGTCPVARAIMHVKYADCEWFRAGKDPGSER